MHASKESNLIVQLSMMIPTVGGKQLRDFQRRKETINIDNFSRLSQEWSGVKFVYVLPFFVGKKRNT